MTGGVEQRHERHDLTIVHRHLRRLHELANSPDDDLPSTTSLSIAPSGRRPLLGRARAWATALVVFSGEGHERDLAARLRVRGFHVTVLDTKDGGAHHDVLRDGVGADLEARILHGDFDVVFLATPCASYSVSHRPRLRQRKRPNGIENVPAEWRAYLHKHNLLGELSARLIIAAHRAGAAWALENPADRGDKASRAWWPKHADHAPIFLTKAIADAIRTTTASSRTFAQCAFEAKVQKWTTIIHSSNLDGVLGGLDQRICRHGTEAHEMSAHGLAPDGSSNSAAAAAYPNEMNEYLADAVSCWARQSAHARHSSRALSEGGLITDGAQLGVEVREACERARQRAPRFASMRNRRPSSIHHLAREPFPGDLHAPPPPPPSAATSPPKASVPPSPAPSAAQLGARLERSMRIAAGPIHISELFIGDTYELEVLSWLRLADLAAVDIAAGRTARAVPSRTLGQDKLQPWARGLIWDTQDPYHCKPVVASTRHTIFKGERQIDRAALRRIASELDWHDADIVDQAGEGGVEVRSSCSLDIVLAFHHLGLREQGNAKHAAKVVEADFKEGWADRPTRHLPFVPCRVLPRNVIFQERSRLVANVGQGPPSLEAYLKARITTDSSHGGVASINAGVLDDDRRVLLPTVQQHGRGLAIADTAGGEGVSACSYVVDAESAYRFCPVQEADLWTQVFVWWDTDGIAGWCVDRRLSFGGAFAPNRFERISTLVAAHIQAKQSAFDRLHPLPQRARLWAAVRRSLQEDGLLPSGDYQLLPRHLQVYIDDFIGAALDDIIEGRADVDTDIIIPPDQITSEGGTPASPRSRVYAHAQLAVQGLRDAGLSAAPGKVVVGDPIIGLGLSISRIDRRIDCPTLKRASMLADISKQLESAVVRLSACRRHAETLVGRLCNLSQVFPELKAALHGGYAIISSSWLIKGRRLQPDSISFREGSTAHTEWIELLELALHLIDANIGVDIAPERTFPSMTSPGMIAITTDASGNDGVGGYAFKADDPFTVYIMSEPWGDDILAALANGAAEESEKDRLAPSLSVAAVELFGATAMADAIASHLGSPTEDVIDSITAIGDSDSAAGVLNSAASGNRQMRTLLHLGPEPLWLGVSVARELNTDADRLSHPSMYELVEADAIAAGLAVVRLHISDGSWAALRAAAAIGVAPRRTPRRKRTAPPP